jgi:hypothetical protein
LAAERRTGAAEIRLLTACARKHLAAVDAECIRSLVPDAVNWPNLIADGLRHDCLWRLNGHLNEVVADRIPLPWQGVLPRCAQQAREADQLSIDEVERISRLLAAAGIAFVPSQVPILGWLASRALRHNEYADFEFLIRERHAASAAAILETAGYLPRPDSGSGGAHPFTDENTGVFLNLQTERTLRGFPVESMIERAASGTIEVEVSGRRIRAISAEDALVHLCVWGAQGYWSQLRAIGNVGELIEEPGVDWNRAIRIAQELQCVRLLLLGACVAQRVLRADVSNEILVQAEADAHVRRLAGPIIEQFTPTEASARSSASGARSRALFRVTSRDTHWQGMVHALRLLASPSEMDREMIHASGNFSPVYAIQRPWRLWRDYGIRDRPGPDLAGYHPTPDMVVDRLLHLAKVGAGDVLYDLGCGDGRIVIRAAKEYGIRAVGVDVNPQRISEARANAQRSGMEHQVEFRTEDARTPQLGEATVIVLCLSAEGNLWLMERLRGQLRPGARVVSYSHAIAGWPADREEAVTIEDGTTKTLYLWHIPSSEIHEKASG